ncbi:hypothetical protein [Paenibacillus sp.]|jgi:hypothetical protein|uniref:hypothetical protein n=1 Tax=Paenibacillus sp. TaxID=58172 RepID=UPI00282960C9|nr:hypothetical protein [Paenibacillus sp.]MDR0269529.1 hypothetical protein [Paenibacillus sp.]
MGFEFTPSGQSFFGPIVTVSGIGGSVTNTDLGYFRTLYGGQLYPPHTEANNYTFHGSISKYQYIGGQANFNSGDIVTIDMSALGSLQNNPAGMFSFSCKID